MVGGVYVRIVGYMSRLYCRERERERAPTRLLFAFIALVRAANKMITIDKLYVDVLILVLHIHFYMSIISFSFFSFSAIRLRTLSCLLFQ